MQKNNKLRSIVSDYLGVREMAFGANHTKTKSNAINAFVKIRKTLADAGIEYKILEQYVYAKDIKAAVNAAKKRHPEITGSEELCEAYISMRQSAMKTNFTREHTKRVLLAKIAALDPMLSKFILYKVNVDHARRTLNEFLVKETPESLEERYKDLLEGLF